VVFHVIEDDYGVADALVLMLREFGHDARSYPDAETFLAFPRPGPEDTVFIDLSLPGMSGADLIRELRRSSDGIRIVIVTGQPQAKLDKQIAGLGVIHLIRKPVEADALRDLI
jgi:FixJ family two-component response regulator